jgi:hypothetical protein
MHLFQRSVVLSDSRQTSLPKKRTIKLMTTTASIAPDHLIDEGKEFVATLLAASPSQLTACEGWTVHDITAHLAAGSGEIADLIENHLAGGQQRATRLFEERERPYREMDDVALRERLFEQVARSINARQRLAELPDDVVLFTGRNMRAAEFTMHSRSERALHRWDIVGRDDVGWEMLTQPELTLHSLKILTKMPILAETLANRLQAANYHSGEFTVVLRSEPDDDVTISLEDGVLSVGTHPLTDRPVDALLAPAARLLALWGRREPSAAIQLGRGANQTALRCLFGW